MWNETTSQSAPFEITGRCQTFFGMEIQRRSSGAPASLTRTFDSPTISDSSLASLGTPLASIFMSPVPPRVTYALMTVGMAFKAGIRTGAQNENPTRLDRRRQSLAECIERNRFPSHERVWFARELGTNPLYDRQQLRAHVIATDNFIQRLEH